MQGLANRIGEFVLNQYRKVTFLTLLATILVALAAGLPSLLPRHFSFLNSLRVDTDPENMLDEDEAVRVFHNRMKKEFSLHDMVVVGFVNSEDPNGIFNVGSLGRIYELTEYIKTLRWLDENGRTTGLIEAELIAPSTVDNIEPGGPGTVKFEWLMPHPPRTQQEAGEILRKGRRIPFLRGSVFPEKETDNQALCLYIPISSKDLSYRFYEALQSRIPIIWQWSALKSAWEKLDLPAGRQAARNALIKLGRLAAFYGPGKEDFRRQLEQLARQLATSGAVAGWQAVQVRLDAFRDTAIAFDKETGVRVERFGKQRLAALKEAAAAAEVFDRDLAAAIRQIIAETRENEQWELRTRQVLESLIEQNGEKSSGAAADEFAESIRTAQVSIKHALRGDTELAGFRAYRSKLANQRLQAALTEASKGSPDSLWFTLAGYRLQEMQGGFFSAATLMERARDFAGQMAQVLAGSGPDFNLLTSAVDKGLESAENSFTADQYYITGLPVAEDTFGVEMFVQMAISAPLAMLIMFLLMLAFFRKPVLIISPMIVALATVILTMGVLVIAGYPVHIMSSMIPIFLMPIAVLDSIHIISEFFDRYQATRDRRQTVLKVMQELFTPMFYTSITSSAGFASLALTPIPPVQVFGIFVAIGIMTAWVLTITFIPAFVMFIPEKSLKNFGAVQAAGAEDSSAGVFLAGWLGWLGKKTFYRAKPIMVLSVLVLIVAGYGISRIEVNDNPIRWFSESHPIREADQELNRHLGGTYMAYLTLSAREEAFEPAALLAEFAARASQRAAELAPGLPSAPIAFEEMRQAAEAVAGTAKTREAFFGKLAAGISRKLEQAEEELIFAWEEASLFLEQFKQRSQVFKDPAVLRYVAELQGALQETGIVGKSNSLADIVKTVHRDLLSGTAEDFRIPENRRMIAECLIQFQNSHRPNDLWHFTTPDYRKTNLWVQLKSGDNKDMSKVVQALEAFLKTNPPPPAISPQAGWFGLTYINVIWQQKMVAGMFQAFAGSFLVVLLLMTILFRSPLMGALSMIPLTATILTIYGAIGLIGKDYDMPVAVLSSLTLGLAVDFAIHFLARSQNIYRKMGSWLATVPVVFGEPARAITRNTIVIAAGFLPLLVAPLVPYRTVGALLATILLVSGLATLGLLPALLKVLEGRLFRVDEPVGPACNCGLCMLASATAVILIALNLHQYATVGWSTLTWASLIAIPVLAAGCGLMSRREKCQIQLSEKEDENE